MRTLNNTALQQEGSDKTNEQCQLEKKYITRFAVIASFFYLISLSGYIFIWAVWL